MIDFFEKKKLEKETKKKLIENILQITLKDKYEIGFFLIFMKKILKS